jgi:2-isopropylmalate synthase
MSDEVVTPHEEHYRLVTMRVVSETGSVPTADITISAGQTRISATARGDGPVDAVFKGIESLVRSRTRLLLYSVNAITTGTDAQGEVTVRLERSGRIVNGNGADTDIIVASAKAYLNALNKLEAGFRLNPQHAVAETV